MSEPTLLETAFFAVVMALVVVADVVKRLVKRGFVCSWAGHAWDGRRWCSRCELWAS